MSKKNRPPVVPEPAESVWIINYLGRAMPWYGAFKTEEQLLAFALTWDRPEYVEAIRIPLNPIGEDPEKIGERYAQVRRRFGEQGQR